MVKLNALALLMSAVGVLHVGPTRRSPRGVPPPAVQVIRARAPIRLDGRLNEGVWLRADSITDFRQREPDEGAPATERTVVRVAMDSRALYVAVRAEEPAAQIHASQLRRDADLHSDDYVSILIDSFDQQRSALIFETNPNGARVDEQLEGSSHPDRSWNGIWNVAVRRDPRGWTAEFRIPFQTLRFRAGATAFGFNVRRYVRARNEEDLWRGWRRTEGLTRLVDEGRITGLRGARRGTRVALRPYVLSRAQQAGYDTTGVLQNRAGVKGKFGINAKLPITGTLTADLTVNTDFAQVEADQQRINLSRYPLFFPEKREFFLESSGIFDFGSSRQTQMFYSRRIGLNDSGPVPILGGARLYGRAGPWVLGLLDVRTGKGDQANDAVIRVRHDVLDNSYVGFMATSRAGPGVAGTQRAAGVDADFPLVVRGRNLEPSFWVMATDTAAGGGTRTAWQASLDYPNDLFRGALSFDEVQGGFNPTLGFVSRTDVIESSGRLEYQPRPDLPGLRRLDFKVIPSWHIQAPVSGSLARPSTWDNARFEWRPLGGDLQSGDHFELNIQRELDAPTDTFDLYPGVVVQPGRYWWTRGEVQYYSSSGHPLGLGARLGWGGFYDGSDVGLHLTGTWRASGHLIVEGSADRDAVRLPQGRFTALVLGSRIRYAFTTRSDFLAYVQYNGESRTTSFDLRFHWIPAIGDDVYVVWTSGYSTSPAARYTFPGASALRRPLQGALVVKAVYRFTS